MPKGRVACLVAAFDYEGYPAEERAGCGPLAASASGGRGFADLAGASRAEVLEFYDQQGIPGNLGFPRKERILEELRRLGRALGPEDVFVFFFAGHGAQGRVGDLLGGSGVGGEERRSVTCTGKGGGTSSSEGRLCFVEPDGAANFLVGDEVVAVLLSDFRPETRVLFVTDCCHAGAVCDLAREELAGRRICQLYAVRDGHCAEGEEDTGGTFTVSLLRSIEQLVREGETEFSVVEVFNACYGRRDDWQESQDVVFERTKGFDPDTLAWPLVPTRGWEARTAIHAADRRELPRKAEEATSLHRWGGA